MVQLTGERSEQFEYWREANSQHFDWQTGDGYFAHTERELVQAGGLDLTGTVLEIGCGEGGNLFHLSKGNPEARFVGLDFACDKLHHASRALPNAGFACGDAAQLPFRDASFDGVLIRDVLHHVPNRGDVVREAARLLKPGGRLAVIEPNRYSPLIMAQALVVKAERGVLLSTGSRLTAELKAAGLESIALTRAQPLPIARVLLHPKFGLAAFEKTPGVVRAFRAAEKLSRKMVARVAWMYLVATATKPRGQVS